MQAKPFKKSLIIGRGAVGRAVSKQLRLRSVSSSFFTKQDNRRDFLWQAKRADAIFVTIATDDQDHGEIALAYILDALSVGKPVVVCEKKGLAYHFSQLQPHLDSIGYTAVVGGGSGILTLVPSFEIKSILGVINGTFNFLCSGGTLNEAMSLGLCEPGSITLYDTFNKETQDVLLKLCILFNISQISKEVLFVIDFSKMLLSESEVLEILSNKSLMFIISISKDPYLYANRFLLARKDGWTIQAAFIPISSINLPCNPKRQQNVLVVEDYGGQGSIIGIGAGPSPTAEAMIEDAIHLLRN